MARLKKKITDNVPVVHHVDVVEALRLRFINHLSYQKIADQMGVTKGAVIKRLQAFARIIDHPELLDTYEASKAKLFNAVELEMLSALTDPAKIKDASLNNVAYAFQQIYNANRLEHGKSTANINYREVTKEIEDLEAALLQYEKVHNISNKELSSNNEE